MTGKERVRAAVRGESVDHVPMVPISMMIAADLIGVPYRTYATDWRELVRGQLAFTEKFGIDHVSVISDPATEAADCGAEISWHDHQPPALSEERSLIRDKETLATLRAPDPSAGPRMSNRVRAVEELVAQAGSEKLIEGWVEGPIAEASDLRGINRVMMDFFDDPEFVNDLLAFVFEMEMAYARAQIEAGAEIIGIGDAAASLLGPELYEEFALPYHRRYIETIHAMGAMVRLHICGDSRPVLPFLPQLKPDIMDLDSIAPVADARLHGGPTQVLTGNIDPVRVLKEGTPETVTAAIEQCFRDAGSRAYLVAAGCEVPRGTPDANLLALGQFALGNWY